MSTRTRSIWLWQLVLAAAVVVIMLVITVLDTENLSHTSLLVGSALIIVISAVVLFVPWDQIPRDTVIVVPLVDTFAVGVMAQDSGLRLEFLWCFPIAWIATHFSVRWLGAAFALISTVILLDAVEAGMSSTITLRFAIVLLCLAFLGVLFRQMARRATAMKALLRSQAGRTQRTLGRVSAQQARATQMFDGVNIAIARVTPSGDLVSPNAAYLELYGIDLDDPTQPPRTIDYESQRGRALSTHERPVSRAARGEHLDGERGWVFDAHGQWRAVSVSTRPLPPVGDESPSTLLMVQDVTELTQERRGRENLAAVVSHELRTPITVMLGNVDLMRDDSNLTAEQTDRLDTIDRAAERMLALISSILSTDRDTSVPHEPVSLVTLLRESVTSFSAAARTRDQSLTLDIAGTFRLTGDAFRLRQLIDNILSNAVKYTPNGGSIRVSARAQDGNIEVAISDSGLGIAAEDIPHLFDDYFRAEEAVGSGLPGSGLGMGIAKAIAESHGGSIRVESTVGRGTTVTITLPEATS
ncbi:sensor histidine kinase [Microbacterium xanthum]|uniref:sensor histidine kinase n=1 Tax=Microbacterium xanthum TaxID=3079794 RepID=UPI002AD54F61|nr:MULTISPECIES: ATP-binding protein [unclassified Microbacterium]MDZ8170638.1 ATP-binding protein [Microbacterium sp. KSW-48]MDZ8201164.1 ATP-binding protein [Microbacterium sp. SSW1-59]